MGSVSRALLLAALVLAIVVLVVILVFFLGFLFGAGCIKMFAVEIPALNTVGLVLPLPVFAQLVDFVPS